MNNTAFEKTYINGSDAKPEGFNRVEFATKALLQQINKTQSFYQKSLQQTSSFSNDEYWYAVLSEMLSDVNYKARNNNSDILTQLKSAEQQLGIAAVKTKRNLSIQYMTQLYASIVYGITTMASIITASYISMQFGVSNAQSLPFLAGCVILSLITAVQAIRLFQNYQYNKNKKDGAIQKAIRFQRNKFKNYNEAEKFILRRVEKFLNKSAMND